MKRNFSISEQIKILYSSTIGAIQGFVIFGLDWFSCILLLWLMWGLYVGFRKIKIAKNGELALGTFQYKSFSETEIDKENG